MHRTGKENCRDKERYNFRWSIWKDKANRECDRICNLSRLYLPQKQAYLLHKNMIWLALLVLKREAKFVLIWNPLNPLSDITQELLANVLRCYLIICL